MSQDKRWMRNEYDPKTQTFQDPDSGLRHFLATNPANPITDTLDETNGQLIAALVRIEHECTCPAHQLAVDALKEHKQLLASLTPPAHLAAMWECDPDDGTDK